MPIGYITQLEDRLVEVETALFQVLAEFASYKSGQAPEDAPMEYALDTIAEHYGSMSKQEKIAEWRQHNVTDDTARWKWWQARNQHIGLQLQLEDLVGRDKDVIRHPIRVSTARNEGRSLSDGGYQRTSLNILERIDSERRQKYF